MAVYYVAHKYRGDPLNVEKAAKITHDLQIKDPANTYICPLTMFSHIGYGEMGYRQEMEMCIDVLSACDKLIVASELSPGVSEEIAFCEKVGIEVEYLS